MDFRPELITSLQIFDTLSGFIHNHLRIYKLRWVLDDCHFDVARQWHEFSSLDCRDAIAQEQKDYEDRNFRDHRAGPFMAQLPSDMLAVITMHRLMSLLMSDQEHGCVKVLHAALQIGEAVEQEVLH